MTEAGWYQDYEDPSRLRWHDGSVWTDHVHAGGTPDPAAATSAEPVAAVAPDGTPEQRGGAATFGSIAFLSTFAGLILGFMVFNAVGALTPVTVEQGTVERLDIEFSSSSNSSNRRTYVLHGSTASGEKWRVASEDAYRIVEREGWPQTVEVAMGDWTGTAERVTGATWAVDHQTTFAKVGLGVGVGLLALLGLFGVYKVSRNAAAGMVGALIAIVGYFFVGNWLGYQLAQWVQSG